MTANISNSAQGTTESAQLNHQMEQVSDIDLWSVRMADSCMKRQPVLADRWGYESGVVLKGIEQVWLDTGNKKYLEYIKRNIEQLVQPDGSIRTYNPQDYDLDQINTGKLLFRLYQKTGDKRYQQALHLLMGQLKTQPRTSEGGFWHKKIYSYQMWLDGIYMAAPFYVQYADCFDETSGFDDAV
ncbi:MAG: glycoside hydrolase family 88 protein, partial [Anaerolineae bacterium]|nr:glycoside hydrolase family 88 protein [Anaerolineae bacterium]